MAKIDISEGGIVREELLLTAVCVGFGVSGRVYGRVCFVLKVSCMISLRLVTWDKPSQYYY